MSSLPLENCFKSLFQNAFQKVKRKDALLLSVSAWISQLPLATLQLRPFSRHRLSTLFGVAGKPLAFNINAPLAAWDSRPCAFPQTEKE